MDDGGVCDAIDLLRVAYECVYMSVVMVKCYVGCGRCCC